MKRGRFINWMMVAVLLCSVGSSGEQRSFQQSPDSVESGDGDWVISLGGLGMYRPEYEGGEDYDVIGFPFIDVSWRDTLFLNPRLGLGGYLVRRGGLKVGVSLGYAFGRDEGDSRHLKGLGDIDEGVSANADVTLRYPMLSVALGYQQQVTGADTGYQIRLGVSRMARLLRSTFVTPSLRATYASETYMDKYFTVSSTASERSGLSEYDAGAGIKTVGFQTMVIHPVNRRCAVQAMAGYNRLTGDAGDSPVVVDKDQFITGAGVSWRF